MRSYQDPSLGPITEAEVQDHQQGRVGPGREVFGYRPVLEGRAGLGFFVPALRPSGLAGGRASDIYFRPEGGPGGRA